MVEIKDIFLIYRDGRLMRHLTNEYDPTQDADVLTSMFTAITDFIEETFKKGVRTIEFENQKISLEQREHFYLAMVSSTNSDVRVRLADLASRVEHKYYRILDQWDGDKNIAGLSKLLSQAFNEKYTPTYANWPIMD